MSRTAKQQKIKSIKAAAHGGRPKIEIDFQVFESLCRVQCTLAEIASVLAVSEDTVERRCEEHYGFGFADAYKNHSAGGKMSLRRLQWKVATAGNVTMLIWLGKQYLAQSDKQEIGGDGGGPLKVIVEYRNANADDQD